MKSLKLFRHPVLCNYYLTYRCNARCSFCDIWERPSPYVDLESYQANLRDLKRLKVRVVDFTGGEPLLHRQLHEFLRLAKAEGLITTITTNGLLYPKRAEKLRGLVDMLHFSLDFPDAQRHNASRGVDCYAHVMRSLDIALELGERPDVLYTVTNESIDGIRQVVEEITGPRNLVLILNPIFDYNEVGESLSTATYEELRWWGRQPNVYLNDAFLDLREAGGNHIENPVCVAASSTIVISPDNKLVLPCYHLGKHEIPIANQLYHRWKSPEVQARISEEGRLPECEGCTINCYMQPSFAYQLNKYFIRALPSTLKYTLEKWVFA